MPGYTAGTVATTMRTGYYIQGRLLRSARVGIFSKWTKITTLTIMKRNYVYCIYFNLIYLNYIFLSKIDIIKGY
jgi:hypothetical protein